MIPKDCHRLAEVDFPIATVSKHAAREKSIRHGHPSTLHLWWARRPLASSRAMLMALLLPDPCDELCPADFKTQAREALRFLPGVGNIGADDLALRHALLKFIGDFADWNFSSDKTFIDAAHALIRAAHPEETPLVVDPFSGGGSIPLEALRLGCEAFASDLNPVACLILKVMLENIGRDGLDLSEKVRAAGLKDLQIAEQSLEDFYPVDRKDDQPVAYLWARTVRCEAPNCGAEIPIFKSQWLSKKGAERARFFKENENGKCVALVIESAPKGGPISFRIARGDGREDSAPGFVKLAGTKAIGNNANVICPCCNTVLPGSRNNSRTATQLKSQRGGADVIFDHQGKRIGGARLLAVVTCEPPRDLRGDSR